MNKLYVLAKVRKLDEFKKIGEYEVLFLYSNTGKNFKRISECTPEVQKLAVSYCPDVTHDRLSGAGYCFNCRTKETSQVSTFEEYLKEQDNLALDCYISDSADNYSTPHIVNELVCFIAGEAGKVFVKCGRRKFELTSFTDIYEILDSYLEY